MVTGAVHYRTRTVLEYIRDGEENTDRNPTASPSNAIGTAFTVRYLGFNYNGSNEVRYSTRVLVRDGVRGYGCDRSRIPHGSKQKG